MIGFEKAPALMSLVFGCLALTACGSSYKERVKEVNALFEERCKNVAGQKIYRRIDNVDGILLLKVRPEQGEKQWRDQYYPGAAFAHEATEDGYITTFLGYEHSWSPDGKVTPQHRGYINTDYSTKNPVNLRGYRYVDVIDPQDGVRYRYTGRREAVRKKDINAPDVIRALKIDPNFDLNVYKFVLHRVAAAGPAPRYGVTYEDHVIPVERASGLASSTVKVLDLQTNDVLGEFTAYARGGGFDQITAQNSSPWLAAYGCGGSPRGSANSATRQFVDQVLIPEQKW